jgi:uroporphyrinogen decarboxylase
VPEPASMSFVLDALRIVRGALSGRAALVGFVGGPFTLATYLIEGGGSRSFAETKRLLYAEPAVMHALLAKLAETVSAYAAAQVEAGAQAVQVFDTWAGELAPDVFDLFAAPYHAAVLASIRRAGAPSILFVNGCAGKLASLARSGADVLSIDWRLDIGRARENLGAGIALQGNVDPAVLLSTPEAVTRHALAAMKAAGPVGHILNLGHGVLPPTPIACAQAFIAAPDIALERTP